MPGDLRTRAVTAVKWSAAGEIGSRLVTPIVFLVLARLLVPEDFGVAAAATIVIGLSQVFGEMGVGKALIQTKDDISAAADAAFWINLSISVAVFVLLGLSAGWIADLFGDPRVMNAVRVQGLQVILVAFSAVPTAIYQKNLDFKPLFWLRVGATVPSAIVSVALAFAGAGYWALIIGSLLGATTQAAILWKFCTWRPRFGFDPAVARRLMGFGLWVTGSGLLGWFYIWVDSLIVGVYLGSHDLGLYRAASALALLLFGMMFNPLQPVIYSTLSALQADRARFEAAVRRLTKLFAMVALPVGCAMWIGRESIAALVFGSAWAGIGEVIGVLGAVQAFAWLVGVNAEAYRAMGRPDLEMKVMALAVALYVPIYLIGIQNGLEGFLIARVVAVVPGVMLHWYVLSRLMASSIYAQPASISRVALAAIVMVLVAWSLDSTFVGSSPFVRLALVCLGGGASYLITLWLTEKEFLSTHATLILRHGTRS